MSTTESTPVEMGRIVTSLTVINRVDQARAEAGEIAAEAVRSTTLDGVLVDTGATTLCLPASVIAQLGLAPLREVDVLTANGMGRRRIFQDAKIVLLGREGTFECVELPDGTTPLIGVIPLEALGIEPDLRHQRLRLLPDTSSETYYTIL
jgi:predicted aspartyl protease